MDARLTNFRTKKNFLYGERTTDEERNRAADQFIEAGRYGEALEFLERSKDRGRLDRVLTDAHAKGDTFLMMRVEKIRGEPIPPDEWLRAFDEAEKLGKSFDAYRALARAGDEERAEAWRAEHLPDYQPFKPEGK